MRIASVLIESFGRTRDRRLEGIGEGVTVITGDNEAGKTTLMEFIRSTLFPSSIRNAYPAYTGRDSGRMRVIMDSGESKTLVREGRKVTEANGTHLPSETVKMDAQLYRSVFAMGLEDLAKAEILGSDEIKSRFLAIPGGEMVPSVTEGLEKEMKELMNPERMTENKVIGSLSKKMEDIDSEIQRARSRNQKYGDLVMELERTGEELEELEELQRIAGDERRRVGIIMSQKANAENLASIRRRMTELEYSASLEEGAESAYGELQRRKSGIGARITEASAELERRLEDLGGVDPEAVTSQRGLIEELWRSEGAHDAREARMDELASSLDSDRGRMDSRVAETGMTPEQARKVDRDEGLRRAREVLEAPGDPAEEPSANRAAGPARRAAGMLAVAAGIFLGDLMPFVIAGGAAAAAAGAIHMVLARRRRRETAADPSADWGETAVSLGYLPGTRPEDIRGTNRDLEDMIDTEDRIKRSSAELDRLRSEAAAETDRVDRLLASLEMERSSFGQDVGRAHRLLSLALEVAEARGALDVLEQEKVSNAGSMEEFLRGYGTEEDFLRICGDNRELGRLREKEEDLVKSMEGSARMHLEDLLRMIGEGGAPLETKDHGARINELREKVGRMNGEMERILGDSDLEGLYLQRSTAEVQMKEACRRWGTLSLAEALTDRVCDEVYDTRQPSGVGRANVYLGLMTEGRYQLESDPRVKDIAVRDRDDEKKTDRQWSSGLGDQVLLSLKMAVAKETGSERMPLILDDVLVRFDPGRRRGACRAIHDFARDQQVLVFSCDPGTYDLFASEGETVRITL
jgi:uncharacterized protein YhaN